MFPNGQTSQNQSLRPDLMSSLSPLGVSLLSPQAPSMLPTLLENSVQSFTNETQHLMAVRLVLNILKDNGWKWPVGESKLFTATFESGLLIGRDYIFSFQYGGISWNWKAWKSKIIFFGSKSNDRRNGYWYRVNQAGKINKLTPTHQPTTYAECLRAVGYYQCVIIYSRGYLNIHKKVTCAWYLFF